MRIALAGTPEFAAVALRALAAAGHDIALVLCQPDRPAGRGMKPQACPVKQEALRLGLALAQPRSLRLDGKFPQDAAAARQSLSDAAPAVLVVAAYGLILPRWVLALPQFGCLNIHASLLPRWRGAAPIQRAIEAGDAETGICIMRMDEGLDTGPVLDRVSVPIDGGDDAGRLHDRLAAIGADAIVRTLAAFESGRPPPESPQPAEGVSYARKIERDECWIDWSQPAVVIERKIRALAPQPGAATRMPDAPTSGAAHQALKILRAEVVAGIGQAAARPGQVVAADPQSGFIVACGAGSLLRLLEVQRAGGRRLDARSFLLGRPPAVGTLLGEPAAAAAI
jgi:methionyl-tRNA formyltransferase